MKKLLFLFVCLFAMQTVVRADDDKPIQISQMPQQAQLFTKMESDLFNKSYDVIFTNGNKVEFDKKGNWKEVDCKYSAVPAAVIPEPIQKYVKDNYPDTKILKLERDKKEYEVKLTNRTELKFDINFNLIDIDM